MTESLPGLELFLSSEKAVEGANRWRASVESAAQAVEKMGSASDRLQDVLDRIGKASKQAGDGGKRAGDGFLAGANGAKEFEEAIDSVYGKLSGGSNEIANFYKGVDRASESTGKLGDRVDKFGFTSAKAFGSIAKLVGAVGAIASISSGVRAFSEYEDKVAILGQVSGSTAVELKALQQAASDLSRNTRFTPREAVDGLTDLTRAGLSAKDAIASLKPTADLARSGILPLGKSAEIVTQTLAQFNLSVDQAGRVADVIAKAADSSQTNVDKLSDSLSKAGVIAKTFGLSLEESVAALAALAEKGVQPNVAGTGLSRILIELANPSDEARQAIRGLGIEIDQVNPKTSDFLDSLKALARSGLDVNTAVRLVGKEFGGLLINLVDSTKKTDDFYASLQNASGYAASAASSGVNTLAAAFSSVQGSVERFINAAGENGLGSALTFLTRTAAGAIDVLSGDADALEKASIASRALATSLEIAAVSFAAFGATKLATGVAATTSEVLRQQRALAVLDVATGTLVGTTGRATKVFATLSSVIKANPFVAVATGIVAVTSALSLFSSSSDQANDALEASRKRAEELRKQYEELAKVAERVAKGPGQFDTIRTQKTDLEALQKAAQDLGRELESAGGKQIDVRKLFGLEAIEGATGQIKQARELIESIPAAAEAAAEAARKQAREALGRSLVPPSLAGPVIELRGADAAKAQIETIRDRLKGLGIEYKGVGDATIEASRAQEIIAQALRRVDEAATKAGITLGAVVKTDEASSAVIGVLEAREKALKIARAEGVEREKLVLLAAAEEQKGQALNDVEKKLIAALAEREVDVQKLIEARRKERREAEQLAEQEAKRPKDLAELRRQAENRIRLLKAEVGERNSVQAAIELENELLEIGVDIRAGVPKQLAEQVEALQRLAETEAELERKRAAAKPIREDGGGDRLTPSQDLFDGLRQQEEILGKVGQEQIDLARKIEATNDARRAGLEIGSDEFNDYVKRRIAVEKLADESERLVGIFVQFGEAGSSAIERLVVDLENGRDVARAFWQDLQRLALRQTVGVGTQQLLTLAGQALAGVFAGSPQSGPPAGTTVATNPFSGQTSSFAPNMMGGVIPAMSGKVVSEFGFLRRGGLTHSFAEGGESTPEAILPLQRDQRGRLGVVAASGGGGDTINMSFPSVRNANDARAMRSTLGQQWRLLRDADRRGRRGIRPNGQ